MANPPLSDNGGYLATPDPSERPPNRRSSERRQLDEALRECEERYEALFASVDCVYLLDFEGRFLEANPAALELLGYEHEEILTLSLSSLLDDAQTARAFGVIAEVRETGRQATPMEFRLRRKTGEYVNVETKASVILRDGQPYAVLGVGRDITERLKVEQALRESERRLVEAQHLGKFGNWEWIPAENKVIWSAEMYAIFGIAPETVSLTTETSIQAFHPDDRALVEEATRKTLEEGEPQSIECRILKSDGTIGYVYGRGEAVLDADGKLVKMTGIYQDITESKAAGEAFRESEERYRQLIESAHDWIWEIDERGVYTFASPKVVELLGYAPEEVLGKTPFDLMPPDEAERVAPLFASVAAEREPFRDLANVNQHKDGHLVFLETSGMPVFDSSGEYRGYRGMDRDITERVEAEQALRERDEQLRQSQKMEAVGQLAGGIAHDFNNLLAVVLGYSDMILTSGASSLDEVRPDVEEIKHAAERAGALTKQILAFSRRQALQPTVVSLNDVLEGMDPLLRRTLGENIELVSRLHPDLGHVEVDVHQFEQVLMNLALNARDAMVAGGRLTLETANAELDERYCRTHPEARPGGHVMLAVSDTGAGMDVATRERIFEPFFTTKAPGAGTGLGLSTVYGIVRQSNGSITVHSELGKGTSFKIYLPRATASLRPESPVTIGEALTRGDETILVVEDEVSLRDLVTRVLGDLGYRVLAAGTGPEALQIAKEAECQLDLLLTDVVLPGGMQGNDLARGLSTSMPDLPVLYVSGYPRDSIVHAGRLDQGVNFLEKPFTPEALATMVRTVLNQARISG